MSTETIPQSPLPSTDPFGHSPAPRTRKSSWLRMVVYVVLIAGLGLIVWRIHKNQQLSAQNSANQAAMLANQPIPVQVAAAEQKPMPIYLTALGTVTPYMSVTVKARVSGELEPVKFTEGSRWAGRSPIWLAAIPPATLQVAKRINRHKPARRDPRITMSTRGEWIISNPSLHSLMPGFLELLSMATWLHPWNRGAHPPEPRSTRMLPGWGRAPVTQREGFLPGAVFFS